MATVAEAGIPRLQSWEIQIIHDLLKRTFLARFDSRSSFVKQMIELQLAAGRFISFNVHNSQISLMDKWSLDLIHTAYIVLLFTFCFLLAVNGA
jgi:hypothetical protein